MFVASRRMLLLVLLVVHCISLCISPSVCPVVVRVGRRGVAISISIATAKLMMSKDVVGGGYCC